jgi:hypothetical protein
VKVVEKKSAHIVCFWCHIFGVFSVLLRCRGRPKGANFEPQTNSHFIHKTWGQPVSRHSFRTESCVGPPVDSFPIILNSTHSNFMRPVLVWRAKDRYQVSSYNGCYLEGKYPFWTIKMFSMFNVFKPAWSSRCTGIMQP